MMYAVIISLKKSFFFKIENTLAIWIWKSVILKQLANCRPTSQPPFYLFLDWWIEQKCWRSIQGRMNSTFISFWMLHEPCNSFYKMTLLGDEQRKQLICYSYCCNEFCLLRFLKYNWVNSDYSCINAYMWKKQKTEWHENSFQLPKSFCQSAKWGQSWAVYVMHKTE